MFNSASPVTGAERRLSGDSLLSGEPENPSPVPAPKRQVCGRVYGLREKLIGNLTCDCNAFRWRPRLILKGKLVLDVERRRHQNGDEGPLVSRLAERRVYHCSLIIFRP